MMDEPVLAPLNANPSRETSLLRTKLLLSGHKPDPERFMRCQKCLKGMKTHRSPDTSAERLHLFLKPSIVQMRLKSLLGIWVFKYLLILS